MADPWWRGLPPADAQVECGGHQHVLRWAEGTLTLPAHPDAEAELVDGILTLRIDLRPKSAPGDTT